MTKKIGWLEEEPPNQRNNKKNQTIKLTKLVFWCLHLKITNYRLKILSFFEFKKIKPPSVNVFMTNIK